MKALFYIWVLFFHNLMPFDISSLVLLENNFSSLYKNLIHTPESGSFSGSPLSSLIPQSLVLNTINYHPYVYLYNIKVLNQRGTECGYHAVKNILAFTAALITRNENLRKDYFSRLNSEEFYNKFTNATNTLLKERACTSLSNFKIQQIINSLTDPQFESDVKNYLSLNDIFAPTNIQQEIEIRDFLSSYEKQSDQKLIEYLDTFFKIYKNPLFEKIREFKLDKKSHLIGFFLNVGSERSSAFSNHWIALTINLTPSIIEFFILNSSGLFAHNVKKFVESFADILYMPVEQFKELYLRTAVYDHDHEQKIQNQGEVTLIGGKPVTTSPVHDNYYFDIALKNEEKFKNIVEKNRLTEISLYKKYERTFKKRIGKLQELIIDAYKHNTIDADQEKTLLDRIDNLGIFYKI